MESIFATYGPDVVAWVLAALGAVITWLVARLGASAWAASVIQRAWVEVQGAVAEVSQTYADAIKAARADGSLTDMERAAAKAQAIAIAKENLGEKGLRRLGRVLGVDVDRWLASKTEQAVKVMKGAAPPVPLSAADAPPVPRSPA